MRFIKGDSLKEAIEHFHSDESLKNNAGRRSLELRKLLLRFTDVCNAIDYAHSRGVLHRDIKPGNVIVGKHGETLVVDCGLAKSLGRVEPGSGERTLVSSSASGSAETLPGSALGTPAYMSPEQATGDLDRLGAWSDVLSLGATLSSLLTGMPPYEGDDVGEILRKVQRGEFAPPRRLDPSIDKALEAICTKAMALKPEARYSSCRALADDSPAVTDFRSGLADSHNNLGAVLADTGKRPEAEAEHRKGLAIQQKLVDDNPAVTWYRSRLANSHMNLGSLLVKVGKLAEAESESRKGLTIVQKLAEDHPESPDYAHIEGGMLHNLAEVDLGAKRFQEACERLREAIVRQ
jgi:serine/threonine protein kinase